MDKNAIKKYAVWARRELISRVSQKAAFYGITDTDHGTAGAESVDGRVLTAAEKKQRDALIHQIQKDGYAQVMEEVAYTWFNRFSALRYMEVNGYLPTHVRVFTDDTGALKPQILTEAINLELDGLDMQKVYDLKNSNQDEALYRYLLMTQCNALNAILPGMFQKIEDYTELLLPDNLLREGSVIEQMVTSIPEEDWTDQVQIIGWLYQYYNAEKKDDVFAALKKNVKITKENIPAATQLFTPDWIVRYMVENSLGRIFVSGQLAVVSGQLAVVSGQGAVASGQLLVGRDEGSGGSDEWEEVEKKRIAKEKAIAEEMGWKYYLPEAPQTPEVRAKLTALTTDHLSLDTLKVIDPCMGSGHILVYMFDVLVKIYETCGYSARDAVKSIVENNLYGLDIDDRAAQLAYFAVMMKARQYDRRFFSRGVQPHVYAIVESNHLDKFDVEYFCNGDEKLTAAMDTIISELHDAKEYGSILNVTPQDWPSLYARFAEIEEEISISHEAALNELLPLVQVAEALAQKYDVVVTNPPYMGSGGMSDKLNQHLKYKYPNVKNDLFSVCIQRMTLFASSNSYFAFIVPESWMFLSTQEGLRTHLLSSSALVNLLDLGTKAFDSGFGTAAAVFSMKSPKVLRATCIDLTNSNDKQSLMLSGQAKRYECATETFENLPAKIFSYSCTEKYSCWFTQNNIGKYANLDCGIKTGSNSAFVRIWHEVSLAKIAYHNADLRSLKSGRYKWFKYSQGGGFHRWYGAIENVVDLENDAANIKRTVSKATYRLRDEAKYFLYGMVWPMVGTNHFSCRYLAQDVLPDIASNVIYCANGYQWELLAYLNSKVFNCFISMVNPTVNYPIDSVASVPYAPLPSSLVNNVAELSQKNVNFGKKDWDSFETSWDFHRHPLVPSKQGKWEQLSPQSAQSRMVKFGLISWHYERWEQACEERFQQLKANEEELNRIFIDIYGLQDELTPEVEDKDVTVRKADLGREIRSFISYAVGCMFGRYSLDVDGLAYAGGGFSDQWVVVSGQYYKREMVEYYVGQELSRAFGMAEVHVGSGRDLPSGEAASERGVVWVIGPDAAGGSVHPFQYRRGTSEKLYEGIRTISVDCKGIDSGTGNTIYDLCSPEILNAISNGNGNELAERGWKDAERLDWPAVHCALTTDHFSPDPDNIIPICDDEYFDDDIVGRFVEFVKTVYGEDTLDENLKFIADALGGKGAPKEVIRNYFLNDFYADHCKIYQKRPIYWLFDSGKKNGFKCLIYLHRYREDTIARIRTDYVHEQQGRYRTAIADLESRIANADTGSRVKLTRQLTKLQNQAEELRVYEEKIHHLADQMIRIDLDDGVKHNYEIFQDVLAKIK